MANKTKISHRIDRLYIGQSTIIKSFLLVGIVGISAFFIWYTFDLIEQLKHDTRSQVEKYVRMWQMAANSPSSGAELQFVFDEIIVKATFPIIVLDSRDNPVHWRNIPGVSPDDTTTATRERMREAAALMLEQNGAYPLYFEGTVVNTFCYGDSRVITQLKWMPFVEIGIVLAFMGVGLIGLQSIRRSEQRHIWVGMAKETAHQLGTPITSLMGWLEMLRSEAESGNPVLNETALNMDADIQRLQKIANRFGKIGSQPDLETGDLNRLLGETADYYRRRLPFEGKGKKIEFAPTQIPPIEFNPDLLGWALENLVKNGLQAVDSKTGVVRIATAADPARNQVYVRISDNGVGISQAAARKVFRAGFTTKKRGWGLGLTLVKRIIEEYHAGVIVLKKSRPGETVFEITLPLSQEQS